MRCCAGGGGRDVLGSPRPAQLRSGRAAVPCPLCPLSPLSPRPQRPGSTEPQHVPEEAQRLLRRLRLVGAFPSLPACVPRSAGARERFPGSGRSRSHRRGALGHSPPAAAPARACGGRGGPACPVPEQAWHSCARERPPCPPRAVGARAAPRGSGGHGSGCPAPLSLLSRCLLLPHSDSDACSRLGHPGVCSKVPPGPGQVPGASRSHPLLVCPQQGCCLRPELCGTVRSCLFPLRGVHL